MVERIPIGIDDFRRLRELGLAYVDKTHLIRRLIDDTGIEVTLAPRPRRFGKSLNLSMVRWYFEKRDEDLSSLFEGLSIWGAGEEYRHHFQRYPVIYITFKGIKAASWELGWEEVRRKIAQLFDEHRYLLEGGRMSARDAREYAAVLDGTASRAAYQSALLDLSRLLHQHHGERALILIDEYDEPLHAAYVHGYAKDAIGFYRAFFTEGLKGNPHLWKGVLTGILRVARESIFSGLNNLAVYSLLRPEMGSCFGFTEPEVAALLARAGLAESLDEVRGWYNGYLFGGTVVYNPWSILSYIQSEDHLLRNYWVNTSSNDLVREMLGRHALVIEAEIETLLQGGSIERKVNDNIAFDELAQSAGAVLDLLLFSGYLRAEPMGEPTRTEGIYRLSIPNREVREVYATTFQRWMVERLGAGEPGIVRLKRALFEGDAEGLTEALSTFTSRVLSYHDLQTRRDQASDPMLLSPRVYPEQVMQVFVLGLLATLEPEYEVRSNRESGSGRPDVLIRARAPGKPGVVLELKVAKPKVKSPEAALREGLAQIRKHDYLSELRAAGSSPAFAFAVAFDGKRVWVRRASEGKGKTVRAAGKRAKAKKG
ncbi:MAG: AAA family ATPase [Byssovorax sp.]